MASLNAAAASTRTLLREQLVAFLQPLLGVELFGRETGGEGEKAGQQPQHREPPAEASLDERQIYWSVPHGAVKAQAASRRRPGCIFTSGRRRPAALALAVAAVFAAALAVRLVLLSQLHGHPLLQPTGVLDDAEYFRLAQRAAGGDWAARARRLLRVAALHLLPRGRVPPRRRRGPARADPAGRRSVPRPPALVAVARAPAVRRARGRPRGAAGRRDRRLRVRRDPDPAVGARPVPRGARARAPVGGARASGGRAVRRGGRGVRPARAQPAERAGRVRGRRRWWRSLAVARGAASATRVALAAGVALVLSPVAIRNRAVTGEWILVSSHGGLNFLIGNHAEATGGYAAPPGVTPTIAGQSADTRRVAEAAAGRALTDAQVSDHFYARGLALDPRATGARPRALFLRKLALTVRAARSCRSTTRTRTGRATSPRSCAGSWSARGCWCRSASRASPCRRASPRRDARRVGVLRPGVRARGRALLRRLALPAAAAGRARRPRGRRDRLGVARERLARRRPAGGRSRPSSPPARCSRSGRTGSTTALADERTERLVHLIVEGRGDEARALLARTLPIHRRPGARALSRRPRLARRGHAPTRRWRSSQASLRTSPGPGRGAPGARPGAALGAPAPRRRCRTSRGRARRERSPTWPGWRRPARCWRSAGATRRAPWWPRRRCSRTRTRSRRRRSAVLAVTLERSGQRRAVPGARDRAGAGERRRARAPRPRLRAARPARRGDRVARDRLPPGALGPDGALQPGAALRAGRAHGRRARDRARGRRRSTRPRRTSGS